MSTLINCYLGLQTLEYISKVINNSEYEYINIVPAILKLAMPPGLMEYIFYSPEIFFDVWTEGSRSKIKKSVKHNTVVLH